MATCVNENARYADCLIAIGTNLCAFQKAGGLAAWAYEADGAGDLKIYSAPLAELQG